MSIDALPPAPAATDPVDTFDSKAFAFNAALQAFRTQANALADDMQINADTLAAVLLGMSLPEFQGTSASSLAIGTGSKTFATQTGKGWVAGQTVVANNGANLMRGTVTSYSGSSLVVNVTSLVGSGTFSSWTIGLSFSGLLLAKSGENTDIQSLRAVLGVGGLPSAWAGILSAAVELPNGVALASQSNVNSAHVTSNCYYDGSTWRYERAGVAGRIAINPDGNPGLSLFVATAGVAGAAITFTELQKTEPSGQQLSVVPGGSTLFPEFKCRAWANFNGTSTGTILPRAGGNVSSITDNGVGDYTVNFTTAMPDANYATVAMGQPAIDAITVVFQTFNTTNTTSACRIRTATQQGSVGAGADLPVVSVAVYR